MGSAIDDKRRVDKRGKTLEEFLRDYDATKYYRPSVTVDAVLVRPNSRGGRILLVKRGGHPYIGDWAFPGGFVEEHESCEAAVLRELSEETGITDAPLRQLVTVSTPGRDPRWRNITVVYCAAVTDEIAAEGGDDAAAAGWFDCELKIDGDIATLVFAGVENFTVKLKLVRDAFGKIDINETTVVERGSVAFDHAKVVCYALEELSR